MKRPTGPAGNSHHGPTPCHPPAEVTASAAAAQVPPDLGGGPALLVHDEEDVFSQWDEALAMAPHIGTLSTPQAIDAAEQWWEGFNPLKDDPRARRKELRIVERRQRPRSPSWAQDVRQGIRGAAPVILGLAVLGILAWMWAEGVVPVRAPRPSRNTGAQAYSSDLRATDAEVEFVRGLGSHTSGSHRQDRLRLLRSYLQAMDRRANWGHIDHVVVRHAVEQEIEREVKSRPIYVPTNGHGLVGARQYAQRASEYRREIRRDESGDDE